MSLLLLYESDVSHFSSELGNTGGIVLNISGNTDIS